MNPLPPPLAPLPQSAARTMREPPPEHAPSPGDGLVWVLASVTVTFLAALAGYLGVVYWTAREYRASVMIERTVSDASGAPSGALIAVRESGMEGLAESAEVSLVLAENLTPDQMQQLVGSYSWWVDLNQFAAAQSEAGPFQRSNGGSRTVAIFREGERFDRSVAERIIRENRQGRVAGSDVRLSFSHPDASVAKDMVQLYAKELIAAEERRFINSPQYSPRELQRQADETKRKIDNYRNQITTREATIASLKAQLATSLSAEGQTSPPAPAPGGGGGGSGGNPNPATFPPGFILLARPPARTGYVFAMPAPARPAGVPASPSPASPPPATAPPPAAPNRTHMVAAGDTLSMIARTYGTSAQEIVNANPGMDTTMIQVGQILKLPASASLPTVAPAPAPAPALARAPSPAPPPVPASPSAPVPESGSRFTPLRSGRSAASIQTSIASNERALAGLNSELAMEEARFDGLNKEIAARTEVLKTQIVFAVAEGATPEIAQVSPSTRLLLREAKTGALIAGICALMAGIVTQQILRRRRAKFG